MSTREIHDCLDRRGDPVIAPVERRQLRNAAARLRRRRAKLRQRRCNYLDALRRLVQRS